MKGMRPLPWLERARSFMQEAAQPFEVALAVTRAGNVFTTHTAVAAALTASLQHSSSNTWAAMPRRSSACHLANLLALGRQNRTTAVREFNMA